MIREMFGYARDHEPCIIFMDEIDAIGGRRFSEGEEGSERRRRKKVENKWGGECVCLLIFFFSNQKIRKK